MKGQAETTEILLNIAMAVLMVVIVLMIKPIMEDFSKLLTKESAEIVARDLAGLITISGAAPHEIAINYETENPYDIDIKDRIVEVESDLIEETSSSSAGVDPETSLRDISEFTITKRREGKKNVYDVLEGFRPGPSPPIPPISGKSKLGFQTSFRNRPSEMNFINEAKPRVVKIVGDKPADYTDASEIKQISSDIFIVGRINDPDYDPNNLIGDDPEGEAQIWYDENELIIKSTSSVDCWEGYNEPTIFDHDTMGRYSLFEIERMKKLEKNGRKACIGSFSVRQPADLGLWTSFMDALNYATEHDHYLALHEYGPERMDTGFDYADGTGESTGRYRKVYDQYGLSVPLIITETGIDSGGEEDDGWKSHTNADDYLDQLKWYDSILQEDDYVIGAAIFHYGLPNWWSFEIYPDLTGDDGTDGPLVDYIKSAPSEEPEEETIVIDGRTFKKISLENEKIKVSILPELGGRIYELINKETGNNQVYNNPDLKTTNWGKNKCRPNGGWIAAGGIEFAFPDQEHGCVYDKSWTIENQDESKSVILSKETSTRWEDGTNDGMMKVTVEINLAPNQEYFTLKTKIENTGTSIFDYQYWSNAMVSPGDKDPRDANIEFIYPTDKMTVHSSDFLGQPDAPQTSGEAKEIEWNDNYRYYDNWKNRGWLGVFSKNPENYVGVYSHESNEGLVRIFPKDISKGVKLFGLGTIPSSEYTDDNSQYIEMWGGVGETFFDDHYQRLNPGEKIEWEEYWAPITDLNQIQELVNELG